MREELFELSRNLVENYNRQYQRYFLKENKLDSRLSVIIGQRGIGKSTVIVQYLLSHYAKELKANKALFLQADHFLVNETSLYEIAEQFNSLNGKVLCFDEIHKYGDWSRQLKSIYDTFPDLKIIASGSSALEIYKGTHDLSRRAIVYEMRGLSFREFIEITLNLTLEEHTLTDILRQHAEIARDIAQQLKRKNEKIIPLFKRYLAYGYYPYFLEFENKVLYYLTLEQNIHTTIEADLPAINPNLSGSSVKKIKKLLAFIASAVPFTPDLKKLKTILDVGDERTLKSYLKYLEDAGLILTLTAGGRGMRELEKPEKIYLNNFNQAYAISGHYGANVGCIRETFFANMLSSLARLSYAKQGDFRVNDRFVFEIGGRSKKFDQISAIKDSFLALDDIEYGSGNKIPLWLFGFLY